MSEWPEYRIKELLELRELLQIVAALNRSNHFLDKAARAIEIAERLSDTDWMKRPHRRHFLGWLEDMALAAQQKKGQEP